MTNERPLDERAIFAIERPCPRLFTYYFLSSLVLGPFFFIPLLPLYFRYHTLRYRFDAEGISMSWGILFRREINLTYARIQDIHLRSNVVERWLGLARVEVQTASGSATAEMTLEGLLEFEAIRDYLYTRMRGARDHGTHRPAARRPRLRRPTGLPTSWPRSCARWRPSCGRCGRRSAAPTGAAAMLEPVKALMLRLLAVPPEPSLPAGSAGTARVFRASRRYLQLKLLRWAAGQAATLIGLVVRPRRLRFCRVRRASSPSIAFPSARSHRSHSPSSSGSRRSA